MWWRHGGGVYKGAEGVAVARVDGGGGCFVYLEKQAGRWAAAEAEQNQKFVGRSPRKAITCSDGTGLKMAAGDDKDKRGR